MLRFLSTMRTTRILLNTSEIRSLKTSSWAGSGRANEIGPTWRQAIDASDLSSASPSPPLNAAGLGPRHVAGDAADLGIVMGVDDDLVIRSDELEYRIDLSDGLGPCKAREQQRQCEKTLHCGTLYGKQRRQAYRVMLP